MNRNGTDPLQKLADNLVHEIHPKDLDQPKFRNRIEFTENDLFLQIVCTNKKQAKHYLAAWAALIEFLPDE